MSKSINYYGLQLYTVPKKKDLYNYFKQVDICFFSNRFDSEIGLRKVLPLPVTVDIRAMATKEWLHIP